MSTRNYKGEGHRPSDIPDIDLRAKGPAASHPAVLARRWRSVGRSTLCLGLRKRSVLDRPFHEREYPKHDDVDYRYQHGQNPNRTVASLGNDPDGQNENNGKHDQHGQQRKSCSHKSPRSPLNGLKFICAISAWSAVPHRDTSANDSRARWGERRSTTTAPPHQIKRNGRNPTR